MAGQTNGGTVAAVLGVLAVACFWPARRSSEPQGALSAGDSVWRPPRRPQAPAGLVARIVDPFAPYFAALRRVSSNADRAYVSTSSPCSMST